MFTAVLMQAFVALVAIPERAVAFVGYRWKKYGEQPFAKSREVAMAARERVFKEAFKFSEACVKAAMAATAGPAIRRRKLTVGEELNVMVGGGFKVHAPTLVDFDPISPGVYPSADSEIWEFDCEGKRHEVGLPEVCFNWFLHLTAGKPISTGCSNGFRLNIYAWQFSALPAEMQQRIRELVRVAEARKSGNASRPDAYRGDAVSRTLGAELRKLGLKGDLGEGPNVRAKSHISAQVFYRYPDTTKVVRGVGGIETEKGRGSIQLPGDPRIAITEVVFDGDLISPTESGGSRRLWMFPAEWGTECEMAMHAIVP